jgi:hypothetical protein
MFLVYGLAITFSAGHIRPNTSLATSQHRAFSFAGLELA